jgi:hypothetical protein
MQSPYQYHIRCAATMILCYATSGEMPLLTFETPVQPTRTSWFGLVTEPPGPREPAICRYGPQSLWSRDGKCATFSISPRGVVTAAIPREGVGMSP